MSSNSEHQTFRPNDGLPTRINLQVYSGIDCCLCDDVKELLTALAPHLDALGVDVTYQMIDGNSELEASYRAEIPVGMVGADKLFKYHVDPVALLRMLERRRQNLQSMR